MKTTTLFSLSLALVLTVGCDKSDTATPAEGAEAPAAEEAAAPAEEAPAEEAPAEEAAAEEAAAEEAPMEEAPADAPAPAEEDTTTEQAVDGGADAAGTEEA